MVSLEDNSESIDHSTSSNECRNSLEPSLEDLTDEDLPSSLIVTNLDISIFSSTEEKEKFEAIFKSIDDEVTFQYFKSFKRARVNYKSPLCAAKARVHCHQKRFGDSIINCYFAQICENGKENSSYGHLLPPSPVRQFLISPPASPPVGWEPREEGEPIINYDLITALTKLTPGSTHELHPPSEAYPGIVVHVCADDDTDENEQFSEQNQPKNKIKIQQTKRPDSHSLSEGSDESSDLFAS